MATIKKLFSDFMWFGNEITLYLNEGQAIKISVDEMHRRFPQTKDMDEDDVQGFFSHFYVTAPTYIKVCNGDTAPVQSLYEALTMEEKVAFLDRRESVKQMAQRVFGIRYAGWVNFLEVTFKEPYDQIERRMLENAQFYNKVLLAARNRFPKDLTVVDAVRVFDYILSL